MTAKHVLERVQEYDKLSRVYSVSTNNCIMFACKMLQHLGFTHSDNELKDFNHRFGCRKGK